MERPTDGTESIDTQHQAMLVAAASVLDNFSRRYELVEGLPEFHTFWYTGEHFYVLKAQNYLRPYELFSEPSEVLLDRDYSIARSRHSALPTDADYWFSTRTGQVCRVDQNGEPIDNESPEQNLENLREVTDMLATRPGKLPLDDEVLALELNYYMADEAVRQNIDRLRNIGMHVLKRKKRQALLMMNIVEHVMKDEPLFSQETLRARIQHEIKGIDLAA